MIDILGISKVHELQTSLAAKARKFKRTVRRQRSQEDRMITRLIRAVLMERVRSNHEELLALADRLRAEMTKHRRAA